VTYSLRPVDGQQRAFKVIGKCARGLIVVPEKKGGVDYVGHMADGRAVYVEAKRCTARLFPLSRVEPHQQQALERAMCGGALAILLLIYGPRRDVYAVPWVPLQQGIQPKSLSPEWLEPYLVPPGRAYLERWSRHA
jgi:penicillin-binding protein-related factor A (putative recombinase)